MNSESSFKFSETKYPVPHRFNQLLWPPKNLSKKTSQGNQSLAGHRPRHPSLATFSTCHGHLPPNLPGEIRTVFSFPEMSSPWGGHGKDACFPMSLVDFLVEISEENCCQPLSFHHRVFMWNCETIAAIARENEKTVLTGKTTGVSDSYRHTPENVHNGTPKISPSITPFFSHRNFEKGFLALVVAAHFSLNPICHLTHKKLHTAHQQAHHPIQRWSARNGTTSIRFRDEGDGLAYQNPPHGLADPQNSWVSLHWFSCFSKTAFFRKWWGEKKKGGFIESGHIYNKTLTWMFRPFWVYRIPLLFTTN